LTKRLQSVGTENCHSPPKNTASIYIVEDSKYGGELFKIHWNIHTVI
jgi:hypothetical protein